MTSPAPALPFHLLAKPTGAACNLNCSYCFFLEKAKLYPESNFRMSDEVLEAYVRQYIESQPTPEVTIAWQGGEPTLMGLDFFRKATAYAEKYKRRGQRIFYTMQTNGILLDNDWGRFLRKNKYLVGISVDGPAAYHDVYRRDKGSKPTFTRVLSALKILKKYRVETNILCTVNAANAEHPLEVYRFFRDELKMRYLQFIPIVERDGEEIAPYSVRPTQWGRFLTAIFDEWVRRDVGKVFVPTFDAALANWLGMPAGVCVFNETCGSALALEHTGDLYACDHYVDAEHLLGNILETPLRDLVNSPQQRDFGAAKRTELPQLCLDCDFRFACHGGCPKNRFALTPNGDTGLNYLCEGYKRFFEHVDLPMKFMAEQLRHRRSPARVMKYMKKRDQ